MKSSIFAFSLFVTASTLSLYCSAQQQKSRIRPVIPYAHAKITAPPGMVYIPGGSTIIKYSQQATDSNCVKKVSLSSFFIDKTEITNQQYRQFVEWVIDSIAITNYLKDDDQYFKDQKVVDSTNSNVVTVRRINWSKVDHKKLFEGDTRSKLMGMLDERGQIKKDSVLFPYSYMRSNGTNPKAKIGSYVTEPVNVYPDEQIWAKDLPNAQTDILVENYFTSAPYDDYPVVGVSWKQAMAYTYWRSLTSNGYSDVADYMKNYHLAFSLPSEAQWVYAAQQDMKTMSPSSAPAEETKESKKEKSVAKNDVVRDTTGAGAQAAVVNDPNSSWSATTSTTTDNSSTLNDSNSFFDPAIGDDKTSIPSDRKGLSANFKQDEGDYTGDGSPFTVPVMSYAPNDFGVYNMIGNVAEWTMDAYSPSAFAFVSDINPVLKYDADSSDAEAMKRKVVRGGSFVSNAKALSPYARDFELQNVAHCFIGFRCVMGAPEILSKEVSTRRKSNSKRR